jgi:Bacterial membrane protein YfhO
MEIKEKIKPALPHIIAVVLFIVISFAYFYPVLEGKVLKANDSTVSTANSKEIRDYREKFHKEPLWTNSIFSGMPAYLISTRFPGNLMKHADTVLRIFRMPVSVLFISMAGFYLLLLIFGVNSWLAIAGAIAYGFSSFFFQILAAGHNTQAIALAYMAPMVGGIYYAYKYDAIKGALLTAFMLSLEILANHPQITYYAMICLLVFGITEFVFSLKEKAFLKFLKTSLLLIIPFIIAIGINFGNLNTIREYGKYSIRGKSELKSEHKNVSAGLDRDYIVYWSYGIGETMNLLIPNYKGGSSQPFDKDSQTIKALRQNNAGNAADQVMKYWGTQPGTAGPHYMGAIVIFLFILGLTVVKGREKWWLLIATTLSILLAWGKNFMPFTNFFIDFFPGYNKFRAVTMTLTIAQFCIPLLGFLALREYYNGGLSKKEMLKGIRIAGGITGGMALLILIIPGIAGSFLNPYEAGNYPAWLTSALISDRKALLRADSFRSLVFIILGAGTILGFISGKLRKEYSILMIALLIIVDLWGTGKRYLNSDQFERSSVIQKSFAPTVADSEILKDKSYYRVLNLSVSTFNDNSPTSWFHKSIGGYHGAKLKRYQELIDSSISRELGLFQAAFQSAGQVKTFDEIMPFIMPLFNRTSVLNMLNTKYVILNPNAPPVVNPHAMGNAWFAEKPLIVDNANMELASVNTIDPSSEAVIDARFRDQIRGSLYPVTENDKIELLSYQPNVLEYKYSAEDEKLAVFSEIYYPEGWKCYIDGKESQYFRTNYVLRGMILPAGTHQVKFTFEPSSYINGNKISLASSIMLILLTVGYFFSQFIKRSKSE